MKIHEKIVYRILDEFKNPTIDIDILDGPYSLNDDSWILKKLNGDVESNEYWHFELTIQNSFALNSKSITRIHEEYQAYIQKLKNEFFRGISEEIDSPISQVEILNQLHDYIQNFKELVKEFEPRELKTINSAGLVSDSVNFMQRNDIKKPITDNPIRTSHWLITLSSFLIPQKECIDAIIEYLDKKIEILTISSLEIKTQQIKPSKQKEPLNKLDKYQTALFFEYLHAAGIIYKDSDNWLTPYVAGLTGHSVKNLRTECFSKIWEIKAGKVGNKIFVIKKPDHNLKMVKNTILDILGMVNDDLKKNESNRNK